jgi:hypothetical protein
MANLAKTVQPLTRHNLAHSNGIIGSHLSQADRTGWARRRQLQRQNRERWLARLIRLGAIGWLVMGMLLPLVMYRYSITQAAPANSNWQRHSATRQTGQHGDISRHPCSLPDAKNALTDGNRFSFSNSHANRHSLASPSAPGDCLAGNPRSGCYLLTCDPDPGSRAVCSYSNRPAARPDRQRPRPGRNQHGRRSLTNL